MENKKKIKREKILVMLLFITIVAVLITVNVQFKGGVEQVFGIYGIVMISYLIGKMLLSFFYIPKTNTPPEMTVSVVIPSYNESGEALLGTVRSILAQDYPISEIFVIDDGSPDNSGYKELQAFKKAYDEKLGLTHPKLYIHRLEKNSGKRHAQHWAFERATGEIFFTVDSDGYTHPDALTELMRPFADEEVMAVTGHISARNRDHSYFTKLLDMRYDNAFRVERAAQSVTGNILVCSGPISCYRREVVMENLDAYITQQFLGETVQTGDDRCLTNYAIIKGKTVYQSTAKCDTDVPDTIRQFLKQQVRWNKSFFRETIIALKVGVNKPITLIWVLFELVLWLLFGFVVILALLFKSQSFGVVMFAYYLIALSISAYARNVYYIVKRPLIFAMAPIYGILHLVLLFPLRFYALATIKTTKWGTR